MELRIFPKKRLIPEKKPKSFILFPYELHAKMRGSFEEKEAESMELIKNHFLHFKRPHVMTSHGNDSLVMCHLVIRVCKENNIPLPQFWLNDTLNVFKEEKPFWDEINEFLGITNHFKIFKPPLDKRGRHYTVFAIADMVGHLPYFRRTSRGRSMSYKHSNTPECCDILKKASIKDFLKHLDEKDRYDLVLVGTRAQESQIRSLGVLQRCRSYLQKTRTPYPKQVLTPLSFWKFEDILEYYKRYNIPKNPTYGIHNLKRMGCASCPAYIGWERDMLLDPTEERWGMLKFNLKLMKKYTEAGTEEEGRLQESIDHIKKFMKSQESRQMSDSMVIKVIALIKEYDTSMTTIDDFMR